MSQKWRRSIAWEREHIPPALRPLRWVLHAFSSIPLAVCLLSLVVVYATLASVPVGLLALAPTYLLYGLSLLVTVVLLAGLPTAAAARMLRGSGRAAVFAACFGLLATLGALAAWGWAAVLWPALRYDPATGAGVRLFAGFVEAYRSTTVRRLPALEMSELEFYAWWPLRVVLLAFVANMVVATVRRIEFTFVNLGVLTVHTGIVVLTLGSIYYAGLKREGDTILLAGGIGEDGAPRPGPPQTLFYDNTETALSVEIGDRWRSIPLRGGARIPRYNAYNLRALAGESALEAVGRFDPGPDGGRTLDRAIPLDLAGPGEAPVRLRIVGYAPYALPVSDWARADASGLTAVLPGTGLNPVRFVEMLSTLGEGEGHGAEGEVPERPVARFFFLPDLPAHRDSRDGVGVFNIEYTRRLDEGRWADLTAPLPEGAAHALVVEVPGEGGAPAFREVVAVEPGTELAVGGTGYTLAVRELLPRPPFPILTEGYRGAESSVAVVRVTTPAGASFDRYVYDRFPEISQDLLDEPDERGARRRAADPAIRLAYLDASSLRTAIDERPDGTLRVAVRRPGGALVVHERVGAGEPFEMVPRLRLRVSGAWDHAVGVERPASVPEAQRNRQFVGTHDEAMLGVEVSTSTPAGPFRSVVWLPFMKYRESQDPDRPPTRRVDLPDGRRVSLAWGRLAHPLPGFRLELLDFVMKAYDHRGAPRDYQSTLRVTRDDGSSYTHVARLNAPLTAPFLWSPDRPWAANALGRLAAGLNPGQFKFSQAGWDAPMWEQTQREADAGRAPRAHVRYTILGVGNNPGIHVVALGSLLVALGIPWAFYIKPLILRRRRERLRREVEAGTHQGPGEPAPVAEAVA